MEACNDQPAPAGIGAFEGPVQPYVFVVPAASSQTALTAEEAYFVFGFGAAGNGFQYRHLHFQKTFGR